MRLVVITFRHAFPSRILASLLLPVALTVLAVPFSYSQSPSSDREMTTTESEPNFKLEVERNVVQVRVVVRNAKGEPVDNLKKEDFLVFDKGKQQTISHFSVERAAAKQAQTSQTSMDAADLDAARQEEIKAASPKRFLALYFDDIRMPYQDVFLVRTGRMLRE